MRLKEPSILEMTQNFASAISEWVAKGCRIVPKEVCHYRISVCQQCEYWDDQTRLGYGKCNAPGCGCGRGKHWLLTSKCPLNRWDEQ